MKMLQVLVVGSAVGLASLTDCFSQRAQGNSQEAAPVAANTAPFPLVTNVDLQQVNQ